MTPEKPRLGPVLGATFASLLYPQVILLMFIPLLVSLLLVGLGLWITWDFWMFFFVSGSLALKTYWIWLLENTPGSLHFILKILSSLAPWLLFFALFALSFPIVIMLNLAMTSLLGSTYLVQFIARRDYKDLQSKGRPRFAEGLTNTLTSSVLFLFFWLITLPLWLIPGLALILPVMLTAWLNRRIGSFDALTDFATDEELKIQLEIHANRGFVLGVVTALLNYVPLAFLIAPVLTMVAFIHFNLTALRLARRSFAVSSSQLS